MLSLFNSSRVYFSWPLWLSLACFCRLARSVFSATFTFAAQWGRHLLLPLTQSHVKCCCIVEGAFAFTCRAGSETSRQQFDGGLHHIWRRPHKKLAFFFAFLIVHSEAKSSPPNRVKQVARHIVASATIFPRWSYYRKVLIFVWRDDGHP